RPAGHLLLETRRIRAQPDEALDLLKFEVVDLLLELLEPVGMMVANEALDLLRVRHRLLQHLEAAEDGEGGAEVRFFLVVPRVSAIRSSEPGTVCKRRRLPVRILGGSDRRSQCRTCGSLKEAAAVEIHGGGLVREESSGDCIMSRTR